MGYSNIFNRPYFVVPPDYPPVQLLFDRMGNALTVSGWHAEDTEAGFIRFSPAVYFGTLIVHPEEASDDEKCLHRVLGFPEEVLLRLDYACTRDALYVLRVGEPDHAPATFAALSEAGLAAADEFAAAFLALDFRSILLGRLIEDVDTEYLFAGEDIFYEGFLGEKGLPLTCPAQLVPGAPRAFPLSDTLIVTIP